MAAKYFLALLVACAAVQVIYGLPSFGDIMNNVRDRIEDGVKKMEEMGGKVMDRMEEGMKSFEDRMKDIWDNVKNRAEKIWDDMKKSVENVVKDVKQRLDDMELEAKSGSARDCVVQARDALSKAKTVIEPEMEACAKKVQDDMQPMMSDMKKQLNDVAPKMSDEMKTCMQLNDIQKCIQGATNLAPEVRTALQNMIGDAGKMAQMLPAEVKKARECATPIVEEMLAKGQSIIANVTSCMRQAVGA